MIIFSISIIHITDKAGLKWEGFNAPIGTGEEEQADDAGREPFQKKAIERGWSGRTWPGRTIGSPLTADGGLIFILCNIFRSFGSLKEKQCYRFFFLFFFLIQKPLLITQNVFLLAYQSSGKQKGKGKISVLHNFRKQTAVQKNMAK